MAKLGYLGVSLCVCVCVLIVVEIALKVDIISSLNVLSLEEFGMA